MQTTHHFKGFWTLLSLAAVTVQAKEAKQPNILVIVADDLGYATTGVFGGDPNRVATPNT